MCSIQILADSAEPVISVRPTDRASCASPRGVVALVRAALVLVLAITAPVARAQTSASEALRAGNSAALAGDWQRVARLVEPMLHQPLSSSDLGESHRLAGIAAFFQGRSDAAERHFLAYLRIELDGRLDVALYPPEVVIFFNDVVSRHAAKLRALRSRPKRSWAFALLPPLGQLQNGERAKAYAIGGAIGGFLIVNLTTYAYLRSWCTNTEGSEGGGLNCKVDGDHRSKAAALKPYNTASAIAALATYAYGVYDGLRGYRRRSREQSIQPFAITAHGTSVFGVSGSF